MLRRREVPGEAPRRSTERSGRDAAHRCRRWGSGATQLEFRFPEATAPRPCSPGPKEGRTVRPRHIQQTCDLAWDTRPGGPSELTEFRERDATLLDILIP